MFGRFGWAEILVIVVLVVILFGSAKIPGMMKNLADGLNIFKKEIKNDKSSRADRQTDKQSGTVKKNTKTTVTAKKSVANQKVQKKTVRKK